MGPGEGRPAKPPGRSAPPCSGDTLQEAVEGNWKLNVSGGQTPWPAGHHMVCYQLNQVGNPSLDPYK
jgi:hypothetical protein